MKADVADAACFQTPDHDVVGARPLAEHHGLGIRLLEQVVEQCRQFVRLDAVIGFLVEQIGAVARHAHVLQGAGQSALVLVGKELHLAPAQHDPGDDLRVFLVVGHLQFGHWHQQVLVGAFRQLLQHFGFAAAYHDRCQRLADLFQPGVAGNATVLVLDLMLVQQLPGRPQTVLIDELDNGDQLLQLVFQRRAGQHHGVGAVDAFQRACGDGVPVLHPLRLVDDHQIGCPGGDQIQIRLELFVIGDLAEIVQRVVLLSLRAPAGDNQRIAAGKALDFTLPLVLERGRADHQHFRCAKMAGQNLGGSDGLDGFAQTHFVANQGPARPHGEQRTFSLVKVERHLEQLFQQRINAPSRKDAVERGRPSLGITPSGHEVQSIVVGAQFMTTLGHGSNKTLQFAELLRRQYPSMGRIKQQACRLQHSRRAIRPSTKMDGPPAIVAQIQFREWRMVAARKGRLGATFFLQRSKHEFNVLAGTQFVGGVIRAGAVVVARQLAAYRHAVSTLGLRVADTKL